jgi:predicted esterase
MSEIINSTIDAYKIIGHKVDALVFEPNHVEKIVISFTGMQADRYNRWSWFHARHLKNDTTLYMVFKDDDHLFYLDRPGLGLVTEHHIDFIQNRMHHHNLNSKQIYTVGNSMGGYAAVYFAFELDARAAISVCPLVDLSSTRLLPSGNLWERKMLQLGNHWIDLDQYVLKSTGNPEIFLIHGQYPPDVVAANKLIVALDQKDTVYTKEIVDQTTHGDFLSYNKMFELIDTWSLTSK